MSILNIIFFSLGLSLVLLWAGALGRLRLKLALIGALGVLLTMGGLLALAVLPGNSFYGPVVTKAATSKRLVALTFDDGPYSPYTQQLLKVLKARQVKATFFMVGDNALAQPDLVEAVKAEGHEIGLHAGTHVDLLKLNKKEIAANLQRGREVLAAHGIKAAYFRPPHGFKDWQVMEVAREQGLTVVNWSVIPRDWTNPGAQVIAQRVLDQVEPGAIILLHDGDSPQGRAPRQQTVEAVEVLVEELGKLGYGFCTISELLAHRS